MIRCIACGAEFPNGKTLGEHKQNNCPEWKSYLIKIQNDPTTQALIKNIGIYAATRTLQVSYHRLCQLFPDLHKPRHNTKAKTVRTPRIESQPVRDPTEGEIIRALHHMSGRYIEMEENDSAHGAIVAALTNELTEAKERVSQLEARVKELLAEDNQTIALNISKRDHDNSLTAKQAL